MDVSEVTALKKKINDYNNRVVKIEASKNIIVKKIKEILNNYGISDIKDYKKLIEVRDARLKEVETLKLEIEDKIANSQDELIEIENIIIG